MTISEQQNIIAIIEETSELPEQTIKKRGRKPKGGKILNKSLAIQDTPLPITNVILHLKCSLHDLNEHNNKITQLVSDPLTYNPSAPPSIMAYDANENNFSVYIKEDPAQIEKIENKATSTKLAYKDAVVGNSSAQICNVCNVCNEKIETDNINKSDDPPQDETNINIKDITTKLKKLKIKLYKNTNQDKKAACFWCTYDYDNPPCYIPKYEMDGQLHGYGSFCRPECAVAFLMEENIDDSTKFERYHLLNQAYSKVYNYKKNIKPAPNPYYLLDRFYGNLSIQEYRKLLKTEHMLLVIDKPMTRILPELHEDNDDFVTNIYGGKTSAQVSQKGVYKVKRQSEKQQGPSKSAIMKENFGF